MALFPDLDTASIPQRWFLRLLFGGILVAWALQAQRMAVVLALAAMLPLLHRHRGWTHWMVTPWVVGVILAAGLEALHGGNLWTSGGFWRELGAFLESYWAIVFSCVSGHYTHLFLDAKFYRRLNPTRR